MNDYRNRPAVDAPPPPLVIDWRKMAGVMVGAASFAVSLYLIAVALGYAG